MSRFAWDKGLVFEEVLERIVKHMRRGSHKQRCYDSILLIQLLNGSRVSEAVRAYQQYLKDRRSELYVRVSKKRREDTRLMVIPPSVAVCTELGEVEERKLVERVRAYARSTYGFNTHSLRYAFVTHLLRRNVDPTIIAKITHHTNLNYILTYTQQRVADELLRRLKDTIR